MSKRSILITLFALFGMLPTLGILLFGIYRHTDWYVRNYATWSEKQLEIPLEIGAVRHHTFRRGTLESITAFQPGPTAEGKRLPLATLDRADWIQYGILRDGEERQLLRWTVSELAIDAHGLEPLWNIHRQLLSGDDFWKTHELAIQINDAVRVGFEKDALKLQKATFRIRSENGVPITEIRFLVPDGERMAQASVTLQRIVQHSAHIMQATLATDTAGLPIRYLKGLFPMLETLGETCRFTGSIAIQQSFSRWSGYFRGRFDSVDASVFLAADSVTGQGTLNVEKARFDGARLVMAEGTFRMTQGTVSRAFLDRIIRITQLSTRGIPLEPTMTQTFRELAFRFSVSDAKMQIYGQCEGHGSGVFMTGMNGPILCEPSFLRQPFSRAAFTETLMK